MKNRYSVPLCLLLVGLSFSGLECQAQEAESNANGASSVTGIFDGVVVGGSRRPVKSTQQTTSSYRNPYSKRRGAAAFGSDSFAMGADSEQAKQEEQKRAQARQQMIPAMDAGTHVAASPSQPLSYSPPPPNSASPANQVLNRVENAQQQTEAPSGSGSPEYLRQLVNQVKGGGAGLPGAKPKVLPKHSVSEDNHF